MLNTVLLAMWISSFVKCLFKSFAPPFPSSFRNQIVLFSLICRISLYTLETSTLPVICVMCCQYRQLYGLPFTLLMARNFISSIYQSFLL